jgi:predicted ATPase
MVEEVAQQGQVFISSTSISFANSLSTEYSICIICHPGLLQQSWLRQQY